jgi:hypothetical protein
MTTQVSAAGSTSVVMGTADVRLPLESYPLQALVSEPVTTGGVAPDADHRAVLHDVDAPRRGAARVAPGDRIMPSG